LPCEYRLPPHAKDWVEGTGMGAEG
jgi:hypothetical protein